MSRPPLALESARQALAATFARAIEAALQPKDAPCPDCQGEQQP